MISDRNIDHRWWSKRRLPTMGGPHKKIKSYQQCQYYRTFQAWHWIVLKSMIFIYLFNRCEQDRTLTQMVWNDFDQWVFGEKIISFTYFMTGHNQKVNKFSMFLICIPFLLVLGYLLVEWFSLTQSSIDGVRSTHTEIVESNQINNQRSKW